MTVYVDPMRATPITDSWPYRSGCHMYADSIVELDMMAGQLKLRVGSLAQGKGWRHNIHYDLTAQKRIQAIKLGAVEVQHGDGTYLKICANCYKELHEMGE